MAFTEVAKGSEVEEGRMKLVRANGQEVVLARVSGKVVAFQNACTHKGAALCEGALSGAKVTCPLHGAEFDVTNGAVVNVPFPAQYGTATPLRTFAVKVEGGSVQVDA